MSAMPENVDVAIFYSKESKRAVNIERELRKLTKEDGERLHVASYNDLPLGRSKVKTRILLTRAARVICLVVTPDFSKDNWNAFEGEICVHEGVVSGKPKVIYVQLCETSEVNAVLQHLTCIDGFVISNKDIATKIKEVYDDQLFMDSAENLSIVNISMPENLVKVTMMVIGAVAALADHFEIDTKMKELHGKMKEEIACNHENCTCYKAEWIVEIRKEEYWTNGSTPNLRNIKPADVDQLLNEQGYLKLASGFLLKKQSEPSDEKDILEYFDNDGVLQLLKRCRVFKINPENLDKIGKIHQIRHELAHHKCVGNEDQEKLWKNKAADELLDNLCGILKRNKYEDIQEYINQVRDMDIQATSGQDKQLKKELNIVKDESPGN